jgi:gamma-butyrobetaine dioxygenase
VGDFAVQGDGDYAEELLAGLPAIWLRANCPCPVCQDRGGQRLASITDVPADVLIGSARREDGGVRVVFLPDQHEALFSLSWLASAKEDSGDDRTEDAKTLWRAGDFAAGPPTGRWPSYLADAEHRARCLRRLLTFGFVLLTDVPPEPGAVLDVAASMGFVRETNYGKLFDVRVTASPANLAYTARAIGPHTDNPYRDPVPTVQLLHCLANAADGGDSSLVDGFTAAGLLRAKDPVAYDVLTTTPVTFCYADDTAELRATLPMIGLSARARIRQVRFNNRSLRPVPPAEAGSFYPAYRAFAEILAAPELALAFRLSPGDCLAFDNTRVLHGRTAFSGAGTRHLQGCYADLDGVASTLALLERRPG